MSLRTRIKADHKTRFMFNFLSLIILQEVETSRFALMKQAAANPDLSKFLVIGALLFWTRSW